MAAETPAPSTNRHRPRRTTVFVAAFVAGAAAAVGVNRVLDVHLAQAKPQVECEPIFVALRSLPQGVPVTVWDVALRDWPKAMLPASALRVTDSFAGCVLKYPLREGQPLLAVQLLAAPPAPAQADPPQGETEETIVEEAFVAPPPAVETEMAAVESTPPAVDTGLVADDAATGSAAAPIAADLPPARQDVAPEATATDDATVGVATAPAASDALASDPFDDASPTPPTGTGQPTLATPDTDPSPRDVGGPSPASPPAGGPSAGDLGAVPFDMPSHPPVDVAKIPSVVSRGSASEAPADDQVGTGEKVRYLVVPERIARQADTSFTTPTAPEGQAATVSQGATEPPRQAASRSQRSTAGSTANRQSQNQAQAQPTRKQPPQAKPQRSRGQQQQQQKPAADETQPNPRAWGGMFPNVSAGLDALGSWRGRSREPELTGQRATASPQRPQR